MISVTRVTRELYRVASRIHLGRSLHQVKYVRGDSITFSDTKQVAARTLVAAVRACTRARDLEAGKRFHRDAEDGDHVSNVFVAAALVDMYSKCGCMLEARKLFDSVRDRDTVLWNALLLGYVENGESELVLELFSRMPAQHDDRTFMAALMACINLAEKEDGVRVDGKLVKLNWLRKGMVFHYKAKKLGSDSNTFVANTLVVMYTKCGSLLDARIVFDRMMHHTVVTWSALLLGYADSGENQLAVELFSCMEAEGCQPNARAFLAAAVACGNLATEERGGLVNGKVVKPESLERGKSLNSQAWGSRCMDIFLGNTLLNMFAKSGSVSLARQVFERMPSHNLVSWTALAVGYVENDEAELALELLSRLKLTEEVADSPAYVVALMASASIVSLATGRRFHAQIYRGGLETDRFLATCLLDFYGKCGAMTKARQLFESLHVTRDTVSWNSLLTAYSRQGDTESCFRLFQRMQEERVHVNGITLVAVLTACSHVGLVEQGKRYFRDMTSKLGLQPELEHYHCMVDILGRGNELEAAVELLKSMPFKPDALSWRTVLAACRKFKNVELGKVAFEALVKIDETDPAAYVLMGSIYGSKGMWEEQANVRRMRNQLAVWKKPGQSWWTDDSGRIHSFKAGDRAHPQIREIQEKLKKMKTAMKKAGYKVDVGSVTQNVSDIEKEDALCGHSERLAIACALINTAPGETIRIMKNLRVCDDCHAATAVMSKTERREIICRDSGRFHVFKDGNCSCGNYW